MRSNTGEDTNSRLSFEIRDLRTDKYSTLMCTSPGQSVNYPRRQSVVNPRSLQVLSGQQVEGTRSCGTGKWGAEVQSSQSTATLRAAQTWRIRASLILPIRSTSAAIETLSSESRFTAHLRSIGSSPGSRITSLDKLRIVVVHGAISVRRRRGMAASRVITTTGRLVMSGSSHHQSSPRRGSAVTKPTQHLENRPDFPIRQFAQWEADRKPRRRHQFHRNGFSRPVPGEPRQAALRRSLRHEADEPLAKGHHPLWY